MSDPHNIPPEFQRLSMEMSMLRDELDARRQASEREQHDQKRLRNRLRIAVFALGIALCGLTFASVLLLEAYEELNHYHNVATEVYTKSDSIQAGDSLLLAMESELALPLQVALMTSRLAEISPKEVHLNTSLRSDLHFDLDDFTRLARTMQEQHQLTFTYSELEDLETVSDLLYLLEQKMTNKPPADVLRIDAEQLLGSE